MPRPRREPSGDKVNEKTVECAPYETESDVQQKKRNRETKLHDVKVQKVIQTLTPSTPEELGALDWLKKFNARRLILDAMEFDPVKYLTQLLEHNKLTILLHDMILTECWRVEVLPQLLEAHKDKNPPLCGSTVNGILKFGTTCMEILRDALRVPAVLSALNSGTDILDFIDYSVKNLQYFLQRNPDHDPRADPTTVDGYRMHHEAGYFTICLEAFSNLVILSRFCKLGPKLSAAAAQRLLHPDTGLVSTLMDLLIVEPHRYAEGRTYFGEHVWRLLQEVLMVMSKTFPAARQLTPECFQKLKLLTPIATAKKYLGKGYLKSVAEIGRSTNGLPAVTPPPYHETILAEIQLKKEAIVAIHAAMGTFEFQPNMERYVAYFRAGVCFAEDLIRCCFSCGKRDAHLRCGHCQYAYYCDRNCQKADRAKHKPICDPKAAPIEVADRHLCSPGECSHCIKLEQEKKKAAEAEAQKAVDHGVSEQGSSSNSTCAYQ